MNKLTCVVPARLASSRFYGKPFASIMGKPMILRTLEQASQNKLFDDVICATDSTEIYELVKNSGFNAILTPENFATGTDRVAWVAQELDLSLVVNVQGDEPLISPKFLRLFSEIVLQEQDLHQGWWTAATILKDEEKSRISCVKVSVRNGYATRFSRQWTAGENLYKHRGIYAFHRKDLEYFSQKNASLSEVKLSLEQLRVFPSTSFRVILDEYESLSVDVPEDVQRVENILQFFEK